MGGEFQVRGREGDTVLVGWKGGGISVSWGRGGLNGVWGGGGFIALLVLGVGLYVPLVAMLWGALLRGFFFVGVIMVDGTSFWGFPLVGRCLLGTCWGP